MSKFQQLQEFQESAGSTLLGVIPVAAVAQGDHESIVIGSIARFDDHLDIPVFLQIDENHPEIEWRRRGRAGHPFINIEVTDDLGSEYLSSPGGGGGGMYRFQFNQMIVPGIPADARALTISLFDVNWEMRWHEPVTEVDGRVPRWRIVVDLSGQLTPSMMEQLT